MTAYSKRIVLSRPLRNVHVVDPATSAASPPSNSAARTVENQQEATRVEQQRLAEEHRLEAARWADLRAIWEGIQEQLVELEGRRQQTLDELQQLSIELAIEVASHVIRREIERDEFPIARVVGEAIKRMEDCRTVTVRLHPLDLKQIESLHEEIAEQGIAAPQVRLIADSSLTRGTCVADGGDFGLLTTWEQQLSDVQRLLREGLDDAQVERRGDETANSGMRRFPDRRETA